MYMHKSSVDDLSPVGGVHLHIAELRYLEAYRLVVETYTNVANQPLVFTSAD